MAEATHSSHILNGKSVESNSKIRNNESYFAWADLCPPNAMSFFRIKQTAQVVVERYSKFSEEDDEGIESLKKDCVKIISDKGSLAYFNWKIEEYEESVKVLEETKNAVKVCREEGFLEEDYLNGFSFVLDAFELEVKHQNGVYVNDEWLPLIEQFDLLSVRGKAGVMCMKMQFLGQLRVCLDVQIQIGRELISIDPEFYEWYLNLFQLLRFERRSCLIKYSGVFEPGLEEYELIEKAMELAPENHRVLLYVCQLVADLIKTKKSFRDPDSFPYYFCGFSFSSFEHAVNFLKTTSKEIVRENKTSVSLYVKLAEFFTSTLPPEYREVELSRTWLEKGLELNSASSAANHRLGITYFQYEPFDLGLALKYLRLAVDSDAYNFGALMDYLQLLMTNPFINDFEIQHLFHRAIENEDENPEKVWGKLRFADILFLRGCNFIMHDEDMLAIKDWLHVQVILGDMTNILKGLNTKIWRFNWDSQFISSMKAIKAIRTSRMYFPDRVSELNRLEEEVKLYVKDLGGNWNFNR